MSRKSPLHSKFTPSWLLLDILERCRFGRNWVGFSRISFGFRQYSPRHVEVYQGNVNP